MSGLIAIDSETTGVDLYHRAAPFLITICDEEYENLYWEWDVNPLDREVLVIKQDLEEVLATIEQADAIVGQHLKFDVTGILKLVHKYVSKKFKWPWSKSHDTMCSGHLLASNHRHDLGSMAIEYLGISIEKYELAMKEVVEQCRRLVRRKDSPIGNWLIADEGIPGMPSVKKGTKRDEDKPWKNDLWLPRAVVKWAYGVDGKEDPYDALYLIPEPHPQNWEEHEWCQLVPVYANTDSCTTMGIHKKHMSMLSSRNLNKWYEARTEILSVNQQVEANGVTLSRERHTKLLRDFRTNSRNSAEMCAKIARSYDYDLTLPKGAINNSLMNFVFDVMKLPVVAFANKGKSENPSLDKYALDEYLATLPPRSKGYIFAKELRNKRCHDTAIGYAESYERFWILLGEFCRLHPSINPFLTDTLRWASYNPNEQNVSKQEDVNVRYLFGPMPGREWWSLDAKNIELRIPAYESEEQELINLFEHPDVPPYYGSTHLLNFHTVYPDIWDKEFELLRNQFIQEFGVQKADDGFQYALSKVGPHCKKKFAATWYQWCKNGGFAVQYGAVDTGKGDGTADKAFHKPGAHSLLKERFSKLEELNSQCIWHAEQYGYVETLPDRTVDPDRGYPLLCTRSDYGRIKPTVPLNYHTQGTACWVLTKAMVKVQRYLDQLNSKLRQPQYFLIMQIHDELVLDFPYVPDKGNLDKVQTCRKLISGIGDDLIPEIPLPVGIEYHTESWAVGETIS